MAGISTSIEIVDKVTANLNKITESAYATESAFNGLSSASDTVFDSSGIQEATQEMTAFDGAVQEIESDLQQTNIKMQQLENETEDVKQEADKLGDSFGGVGKIIAGLGLGYIIKQQVGEAIEYASDLTEVQNVVDTVYGEASERVNAWSKTTLDAFGLNELSAKRYAGTLGAMLSSSGLEEQAEGMSLRLTELAGDMASFYNLDAEEAFNKIRSGISGETEPLKQLGINMSVANLEAYALSQGIETSYNEMDQASQTMLRYAYLMSVTGNAQGDFARTSNSYANQTKLLKENWSAFTGQLATKALPVLTQGIQLLNSGVSFISNNWSIIQPILMGLLTIVGLYTTALLANKAAQLGTALASGVKKAADMMATGATFKATAAQYGYNAALLACPATKIVMAIILLIAVIVAVCNWIAKMTGAAQTGFGIITGGVNVVIQFFKNLGLSVANIALGIGNALAAVGTNIWTAFSNAIKGVQSLFYDLLATVLTTVEGIAEALNEIPFVEFDYQGVSDAADEYAAKAAEIAGSKEEYVSIKDAFDDGMNTFETFKDGWVQEAFKDGADWGDSVADKLGSFSIDETLDDVYTSTGEGSVADMLNNINGNTSDISDGVNISNENLKYLRDIAEKEAINRFTTAEIKVDMTNHNNISSDADLDGIVNALSEGLLEEMSAVAQGVH
jgi:hypothetical protein